MTKQKVVNLLVWVVVFFSTVAIGYFLHPALAFLWLTVCGFILLEE